MTRNVYLTRRTLSLKQARAIIDATLAHAEAHELNPLTVTVMDISGCPISCDSGRLRGLAVGGLGG